MTDRGQATVEFAMVLPLVLVVALGLLQVAVLVADQLTIGLAAREGARAAAVAADATGAAHGAVERTAGEHATVEVSSSAHTVTVVVRRTPSSSIPLWGLLVRDRELAATATMAVEPPDHPAP